MTASSPVGASAPATVEHAFRLWMAGLAVSAIGAVVDVLLPPGRQEWIDYARSLGQPPAFGERMAAAAGGSSVVTFVVTLVVIALFAWFGLRMRAGANWARIVDVVIAALGIVGAVGTVAVSGVVAVPRSGGVLGVVLQSVSALLLLGFVWFAFQRPSNAYYATPR